MALPSSRPSNRLSVVAQGPGAVNLADFSFRPAEVQSALAQGFQTGSNIVRELQLRPKVTRAEITQAEAATQEARRAGEASRQGFEILKDPNYLAREANAQVDAIEGDLFRSQQERSQLDTQDPEYVKKLEQSNKKVAKLTGDLQLAKDTAKIRSGLQAAEASKVGAAGILAAGQEELAPSQVELARIQARGAVARAPVAEEQALIEAGTGVTGARTARILAAGGEELAPSQVELARIQARGAVELAPVEIGTARSAAETANILANQGQPFAVRTGLAGAETAARQAEAALKSVTPRDLRATAQAQQELQTLLTLRQQSTGQAAQDLDLQIADKTSQLRELHQFGAVGVSPDEIATQNEVLQSLNISPFNEDGTVKSAGQKATEIGEAQGGVRAETVRARNAPFLKTLDDSAIAADDTLDTVKSVRSLLVGVDTGFVYGAPGIKQIDQIAAWLGSQDSAKRRSIQAQTMAFVGQVRRSFPGQVSNFEMRLYEQAVPGAAQDDATNARLLTFMEGTVNRAKEKAAFYNRLIGPQDRGQVDSLWDRYVESNPILIEDAATSGVEINSGALSSDEWIQAMENPADFVPRKQAEAQQDVEELPLGAVENNRAYGDSRFPFVRVDNRALPNSNYWSKLRR